MSHKQKSAMSVPTPTPSRTEMLSRGVYANHDAEASVFYQDYRKNVGEENWAALMQILDRPSPFSPTTTAPAAAPAASTHVKAKCTDFVPSFDLSTYLPSILKHDGTRSFESVVLNAGQVNHLLDDMVRTDPFLGRLLNSLCQRAQTNPDSQETDIRVMDDRTNALFRKVDGLLIVHICDAKGRPQAVRRHTPHHHGDDAVWVSVGSGEPVSKNPLYIHPITERVHMSADGHDRHGMNECVPEDVGRLVFQYGYEYLRGFADPESALYVDIPTVQACLSRLVPSVSGRQPVVD